ncbi:hypothetical protein EEDFHM_04637 [Methylorubrum populi]
MADVGDMDFVYRNAPLIEVIVEVRWKLFALSAIPGGAVDPFFIEALPVFQENLRKIGYGHTERLVAGDFPLEMMPGQPIWRFRREPSLWPLYQLGPGLLTMNAVPPYRGWVHFRDMVSQGIEAVQCAYEAVGGRINVERLALRYLNSFTDKLGYGNHAEFLSNHLGLSVGVREGVESGVGSKWLERAVMAELTAPLDEPAEATITIKAGNAHVEGSPACLFELAVARGGPGVADYGAWFDVARSSIHKVFNTMLSEELKERIGPKDPVS